MVTLEGLHAADRRFIGELASRLGREPAELLAECLVAGASPIRTVVRGGRFETLSLRELGPALRLHQDGDVLPFGLLDALVELDCTGLGLSALELEGLPRLRVLCCGDNHLTHLEPSDAPLLERLDCSANRLMVLDLRRNPALAEVDCSGNQLTAVLFAPRSALRLLRCARNELMVLDLGEQPVLEALHAFRNPLLALRMGSAPALHTLDCARGELTSLDLSGCPGLAHLDCARNRLDALDVAPCRELRHLDCSGNYVDRLDLTELSALQSVRCSANQLRELRLGAHPALDELLCAENRLRALDVSQCPALAVLECGGNELTALDLSGNPALCAVDARGNSLRDVQFAAPGLAHLLLSDNPLRAVDVRALPELCRFEVDARVEILAEEAQLRRLDGLRRSLEGVDLSELDTFALHAYAIALEGADEARMLEVIRHPRCDLGTALLLYWMNAPHYYLRYGSREEVEPFERPGWDLLVEIEQRVAEGFYQTAHIWFDPTHDKQIRSVRGYDWTRPVREARGPVRRSIPERMMEASRTSP